MKILVTGASSYVGSRVYIDLQKKFDVIGTYNETKLSDKLIHLDTTVSEEIKEVITQYKPEVIIHAAANANSRWCEDNPEKAIALNQESTKSIVNVANEIGAKVVLISSFAAIYPTNVYGRTKAESERYAKNTKKGYIILRPSLIIGFSPNTTNDRPFNRILKNLDHKTEAVYDTSWKFQPTYLSHISEIISVVLERNLVNEVIPVVVKELKTRYEIAKDILTPFGIEVKSVDNHDTLETITDDLRTLERLRLPKYTYPEIINKIIDEIKHREQYRFN